MTTLPVGLRTALESGTAVLFVGSGAGYEAFDQDGRHAPDAKMLARALAQRFSISASSDDNLAKIAAVVELRRGREALDDFLREELVKYTPSDDLQWLFTLTWRAIFTTNYDRWIQQCYERIPNPTQRPVTVADSGDLALVDPRVHVPIYHLHGALFDTDRAFALITEQDYARYEEHRKMLFELLKLHYATSSIVYVGYSNTDSDWRVVVNDLRSEFAPSSPPPSFRVTPNTDELDREILASQDIYTIDADIGEFQGLVKADCGDLHVLPSSLDSLRVGVPAELGEIFTVNPSPVLRLLDSFTYLNREEFAGSPNTSEFLDGNYPSWPLIDREIHFHRDVENLLIEDMLDFATSESPRARAVFLLGPAGYGTSTVLMSLAATLVKEQAGPVLFLRRGWTVLVGDLEFASTLFPAPIFIFVDNGADYADALSKAMTSIRAAGRSVYLMVGERANEWAQIHSGLRGRDYSIEPLSDGEVDRLLRCLEANGALNHLADLTPELQRQAIKVRNGKELLVAMKEATEGMAFEAIIESEYRGMATDFARQLYGYVCALYRLKLSARDSLLAKVMGRSITDFYGATGEATEGVIYWDCVDEQNQVYAARARHHVIAEIVWQRCLDPVERETYVLELMHGLNLNFSTDAAAFNRLVRSDEAVGSLASFESKAEFFDMACRKYPDDPFVRQHYARMLRREGRTEAALRTINDGLGMRKKGLRSLRHTKGMILEDLAVRASSDEIGRRRVLQAEKEFKDVIADAPKDEYGHHGLADLYFRWARRVSNIEERGDYLTRCEQAIGQGLKQARDKERLWVLSAEVSDWIGDSPEAVASLRAAVQAAPAGRLGRYLLAERLLKDGEAGDAQAVLEPLVEAEPENYRACRLAALIRYRIGRPLAEAIAVLGLAKVTGMRDGRYIAIYGGMLALSHDAFEAERVFRMTERLHLRAYERNRVDFVAFDTDGQPAFVVGEVVKKLAGFAFVKVDGMPDFFLPAAKFPAGMELGSRLRFVPGFTPRGPVVTSHELT